MIRPPEFPPPHAREVCPQAAHRTERTAPLGPVATRRPHPGLATADLRPGPGRPSLGPRNFPPPAAQPCAAARLTPWASSTHARAKQNPGGFGAQGKGRVESRQGTPLSGQFETTRCHSARIRRTKPTAVVRELGSVPADAGNGGGSPSIDLTQLATLGEFVGGVAVVVTLIYLAVQVRQNTCAAKAANNRARIDGHSRYLIAVTADPVLA